MTQNPEANVKEMLVMAFELRSGDVILRFKKHGRVKQVYFQKYVTAVFENGTIYVTYDPDEKLLVLRG